MGCKNTIKKQINSLFCHLSSFFHQSLIYFLHFFVFRLSSFIFYSYLCRPNMIKKLVSVIMPTYNSGRHLEDSIESILNQTYNNLELLITDDCSTDELTHEILKKYSERDSRVDVCYLTENHGPGYARDKSIERARGRFIAFCDSDDRWFPEKLEKQIRYMHQKRCSLCYSSYITCDDLNEERGIVIAPHKITFNTLKKDNKIGCLTAVYDIERLGKKYYMPVIRKRQDWALFLTILRDCGTAYALTEPLAYYRIRQNSVSSNKLGLIKYNVQVYQDILDFSPIPSYLYFFFIFIPTHLLKLIRKKRDSQKYLKNKRNEQKRE